MRRQKWVLPFFNLPLNSFSYGFLYIKYAYLLRWKEYWAQNERLMNRRWGTPARYLFSRIYAGDRHGHDDGAAASDKFNGGLQDVAVGIARALCGTGWREMNRNGLWKHDYFVSGECLRYSESEHLDLVKVSAMFAVRWGCVSAEFMEEIQCGRGCFHDALELTLRPSTGTGARDCGGLVTAPDRLTDYGLHLNL